jgi:hypothetical protein
MAHHIPFVSLWPSFWYTVRMKTQLLKDTLGWGFILWFVGYVLGIVFYFLVPPALLGWFIMPIGTLLTLWVLFKKVKGSTFEYFVTVAVVWTLLAIVCDYLFLVKLLKADGYYKLDVYVYYAVTLALPLLFGLRKRR